jgi:hypothetical protein
MNIKLKIFYLVTLNFQPLCHVCVYIYTQYNALNPEADTSRILTVRLLRKVESKSLC